MLFTKVGQESMCTSLGWSVIFTITDEKGSLESLCSFIHHHCPYCSLCGSMLAHIGVVFPPVGYNLVLSDGFKEVERKLPIAAVPFNVPIARLATMKHPFIIKIL